MFTLSYLSVCCVGVEPRRGRSRRSSGTTRTRRPAWTGGSQSQKKVELEDKAKVVASVWGVKFVQFFAALAVLPLSIWKNRMNSTCSFNKTNKAKQLQCGKELNKFCPTNRRDDLCLGQVRLNQNYCRTSWHIFFCFQFLFLFSFLSP